MKKLFIIAALLIAGTTIQAQDFKPVAKSISTDFGLDGGLGDTDFNLLNSQLKFRYFKKSDFAYRLGFEFDKSNYTNKAFGSNNEVGTYKYSNNNLFLNLGAEKHFKGTDRLSPYVGADLLFGTYQYKSEYVDYSNESYSQGATYAESIKPNFTYGVKAFLGADYYIAKHLYLGVEAGIRFQSYKEGDLTKKYDTGETAIYPSAFKETSLNNTMFSRIRIGFVF